MILEIIFVCLFVCGILINIKDSLNIIGWFLSIPLGFVLVIMAINLMTLSDDFGFEKEKYYNLKEQVEHIETDDVVTAENLRNQVLEMNNTISKHKSYKDNIWIGMWYSEDIANLEPLKWKQNN